MTKYVLAISLFSAALAQAPRDRAELAIGDAIMVIDYGQPSLNGRDMLTFLRAGHFWRLGADEATRFETSRDLVFDDVLIPAGSYSLFLKRGDGRNRSM